MARKRRAAAAARAQPAAAAATLLSLPALLRADILGSLPADARLLAAAVCRGWRAELAPQSLWRELDLSAGSGVARVVTPSLLLAAAARAGGNLRSLNLSGLLHLRGAACAPYRPPRVAVFPFRVLLQCAADNAGALRELRLDGTVISGYESLSSPQAAALLEAAPRLRCLYADMRSGADDERDESGDDSSGSSGEPQYEDEDHYSDEALLRNVPPFGPLRIVEFVSSDLSYIWNRTPEFYTEKLSVMHAHTSLTGLQFDVNPNDHHAALLFALAAHALCDRLTSLCLDAWCSGLTPTQCLTAILSRGMLRELVLGGGHVPLVGGPHAAAFCRAMRAAPLEKLTIINCCLLTDAPSVLLVNELIAHPTLQCIYLGGCARQNLRCKRLVHPDAPDALGQLLSVNSPALQELNLCCSSFNEADLAPLLAALRSNTHLRLLDVSSSNLLTQRFLARLHAAAARRRRGDAALTVLPPLSR
jgi:hypothetical protein